MYKDKETEIETSDVTANKKSVKPIYMELVRIPVWAIYFLILSTVALTFLILVRIWVPDVFDDDFFWKIVYSYLTLIVSTFVISQMAEAIKFVRSDKE